MKNSHLAALFDEHQAPTHASKRQVHSALEPVTAIVADLQRQLIVYRQLVRKAKLAEHDAGLDWKMEHIDQTFRSLQTNIGSLETAAMNVADDVRQLDRYLAEAKQDVERVEALAAAGAVERISGADVDTNTLDTLATERAAP